MHKQQKVYRFPRHRSKSKWRNLFHSDVDFSIAPPLSFAIEGFLQNDVATLIAGLSGHGKTLVMLSMIRALLASKGAKLWRQFKVRETASRVLYITPEVGIIPVKDRIERFGLMKHVEYANQRLFIYTLSAGPTPKLDDPLLLEAAKKAYIFLDPAIRFGEGGDENSAGDNKVLAEGIFGLLRAGARAVIVAHHSPKAFATQNYMTLENMLRGTGDIGAMVATAWGIRQIDKKRNILHIENIKPRDFEPCEPFDIVGRPYIDEDGDFRMHKSPGESGELAKVLSSTKNKGGAPPSKEKLVKLDLVKHWVQKYGESVTSTKIVQKFKARGLTVGLSTARKYLGEVKLNSKRSAT